MATGLDLAKIEARHLERERLHERDNQILELRLKKYTLIDIGEIFGITPGRVGQILQRLMSSAQTPKVEELRNVMNERLEQMIETFMPRVLNGDIPAAQIVLRIFERQAKIFGMEPRNPQVEVNFTEHPKPWLAVYAATLSAADEFGNVIEAQVVEEDPLQVYFDEEGR